MASAAASTSEGFDVNRSQVSDDALTKFLTNPVSEDITSVPGIGPAAAKMLATASADDPAVTTTYQLIGKFLLLRKAGMTSKEHCDAMWFWLKAKGVASHRAGVVHSIAEKCDTLFPGIYDR